MPTLKTQRFTFEPDMKVIREQCDQVVRRDPSLAQKIAAALKSFDKAKKYVDNGNVPQAFEKLSETVQDILDIGADELEASCFFYLAFLALAVGDEESGVNLLNGALHKTRNPWLALAAYNRLMIHHLTNENLEMVMRLASATKKMASGLPRSSASMYFMCGASYNIAEANFRRGDFRAVLPDVEEALAGFRKLSMKAELAKCQGLLGNALIRIGEEKRGIDVIEDAIKLFRELKNDGEIAFLLQGRGLAIVRMGNKLEALKNFREALKIFRSLGETKAVNSTLALIAGLEAAD